MICANYQTFRSLFATPQPTLSDNLTFTAPDTITAGAGDFLGQRFDVGMVATVTDSASNNFRFLITSVSTSFITVAPYLGGPSIVNEGSNPATVSAVFIANDGWPTWPVTFVNQWGPGFTFNFTGGHPLQPLTIVPVTISINGFADDAVDFVDEWDWYVSQRTDDVNKQWLTINRFDAAHTKSGTVIIGITSLATSELEITGNLTVDQLTRLMKNVTIYVQRRSNKAIYNLNFLPYTMQF